MEPKPNPIQNEIISGKEGVKVSLSKAPEIQVKNKRKIRVLWYSDFLRHTGFGNVAEEILSRLLKTGKYEFTVLGINYNGTPYNFKASEYYHLKDVPVFPASFGGGDFLGHSNLLKMLDGLDFDLFFTLQDTFNMVPLQDAIDVARQKKRFKYIFYFPVDGVLRKDWVKNGVRVADIPVVYNEFGKKEVLRHYPATDLQVIPHGVDLKIFKPFDNSEDRDSFRKNYFCIPAGKNPWLISSVARNQQRKDLPRTILAFGQFLKRFPEVNAYLYLHCFAHDNAGHNLKNLLQAYLPEYLWERCLMPSPEKFGENGLSPSDIAKVYASSDLITSTSLGEGWNLSVTEAMACGVPLVIPKHTSHTELIGANQERGYLVECGTTNSEYVVLRQDNEVVRPLTNIDSLVNTWKHVYDNQDEAKKKAGVARDWVQNLSWDKVAKAWDIVFTEAYDSVENA